MARSTRPRKTAGKGKASAARATRKATAKVAVRRTKAATARKAGSARKSSPTRKAGPAQKSAARRKAAAKPQLAARKDAQRFTVSHLRQEDFVADGLRAYALYRDLGIAAATNGLCRAHVIRFVPPCTDEVRKRHLHEAELQMIYVLKGWVKNEFEGHGEQLMQAGSCWLQPPGIKHTVLDFSDDCEVLEIIVPADFKTVELQA